MQQQKVYAEAAALACGGMVGSALFAFNSNIDLVIKTDAKGAAAIAAKMGLKTLAECARKGVGSEEIVSRGTLDLLMRAAQGERRIGGQAGNMANLAAALGVRTYIHSSVVCKELTQHLHPGVKVPSPFCFQNAHDIMSDGNVPVHVVIDFGKDRYIAVNDMHNTHMLINRNFKRCMEHEVMLVDRAVVSGFHLLDIPEPKGRVEEVNVLLRRWKGRNRRLKVHLELGHYKRKDVLAAVLELVAPFCDSIGFNEPEARQLADAMGVKSKDEAAIINEVMEVCPAAVLHTRDYAVMAGEGADGAGARLALGHLLAAFKAKEGRDPAGAEELARFEAKPVELPAGVKKKFGRGSCVVPALSLGTVGGSLGLGDAFSVGYFCSKGE
ncbi:MAG: ADP-dependent glucokinase/phosphofructokinase [Candidatus Burarchaeum sp.]|nr:ADP-dependent glucokinase/phosphofructokinase [Candidatus Burarchaeum sp.]MDO8339027.1 ADP-dependent glucokinase/phosphofructokinase [Candidatus Burarchaeum sp.]